MLLNDTIVLNSWSLFFDKKSNKLSSNDFVLFLFIQKRFIKINSHRNHLHLVLLSISPMVNLWYTEYQLVNQLQLILMSPALNVVVDCTMHVVAKYSYI